MAQFLCPPLSESWILSASWGPARPPPTSDRDFGCSPASSPDSWDSAPAGTPAGQSLTKIETLRLAIRYIGHLSAVLGLSEESLQRRRRNDSALPRGCALCPDGGPKQTQTCGPGLGSAASAAACWGSPPACPAPLEAPEPRDLPVLYHEAACPEGQAMEPDHASPLFPGDGDVLALLETWMPLEWPPA
nr:mesoderm posterior protein 1 [Vicugna pacos]